MFLFQCEGGSSVSLPESLLFVSTLDGSLHAISKQTGDIKWTLKEGVYMCIIKSDNRKNDHVVAVLYCGIKKAFRFYKHDIFDIFKSSVIEYLSNIFQ